MATRITGMKCLYKVLSCSSITHPTLLSSYLSNEKKGRGKGTGGGGRGAGGGNAKVKVEPVKVEPDVAMSTVIVGTESVGTERVGLGSVESVHEGPVSVESTVETKIEEVQVKDEEMKGEERKEDTPISPVPSIPPIPPIPPITSLIMAPDEIEAIAVLFPFALGLSMPHNMSTTTSTTVCMTTARHVQSPSRSPLTSLFGMCNKDMRDFDAEAKQYLVYTYTIHLYYTPILYTYTIHLYYTPILYTIYYIIYTI